MTHPQVVEIEINSYCNMSCSYCPNSVAERIEKGDMDIELFTRIVEQLQERNYTGRIAFDFYNEPMLSPNFSYFLEYTKEHLPQSKIFLYTNGTQIRTADQALDLIDKGIERVTVTRHEQINKYFDFKDVYKMIPESAKHHFVMKDHSDLELTNRGGSLTDVGPSVAKNLPCQIPSVSLTVTVKGNVLPCFEDFYQENIMGNVRENNIIDIWNGPKFNEFRQNLKAGKRNLYRMCDNCNRVDQNIKSEMENQNKSERHFLDEKEIEVIQDIMKSGDLFRYKSTKGHCFEFEEQFSNFLGTHYSLLVNSGTNALVAALLAGGVRSGDEVIIPSYTFVATASAVINIGAYPVIANIDDELGISTEDLESKINSSTKAIICVHMDGLACDIENVSKIAKKHDVLLIEDACQAMGASFRGQQLGSFGDFGCFSLNKDKTLTAGEGGIVTTNNRSYYENLCALSDSAFSFNPTHQDFFHEITPFLGQSMRVSEITGVIMKSQLAKIHHIVSSFRLRKQSLLRGMGHEESIIKVRQGHDPEGSLGTIVHLDCQNPDNLKLLGKSLRDKGIFAMPRTIRPAHVAWKWGKFFNDRAHIDPARNPFLLYPEKKSYNNTFELLPSIQVLSKTLGIEIDNTKNENEYYKIGQMIAESLQELRNKDSS